MNFSLSHNEVARMRCNVLESVSVMQSKKGKEAYLYRCGCPTSWILDTPSPSALNGTDQREVPIGGVTKWHDLKPSEGLRESEGCRQSNDCCAVRFDERNGGVSVMLDCFIWR